jgi:phosphate:Na+ symporter
MLITAIIQSGSITTGLCILLVQQNVLAATAAIPIVIGANIGTTATALLASAKMQTARRVAVESLLQRIWRSAISSLPAAVRGEGG